MTKVIGYFFRKADAEARLEYLYAAGELSPQDFIRIYRAFGHMYAIEIWER